MIHHAVIELAPSFNQFNLTMVEKSSLFLKKASTVTVIDLVVEASKVFCIAALAVEQLLAGTCLFFSSQFKCLYWMSCFILLQIKSFHIILMGLRSFNAEFQSRCCWSTVFWIFCQVALSYFYVLVHRRLDVLFWFQIWVW